jgi:hypothetical protein
MSNLSGVQFQSKDWNPFTAAAGLIDKLIPEPEKDKSYKNAMVQQSHTEQTSLAKQEKPTPANTGAPVPGYRKRGPITPINDRSTSARHTKEQHSNSSNYRGEGPTYSSKA